jgi:ubiquitin C-terminal hydrolase
VNDIGEDWKRYEKWTIDGTGWDEDENPNASDFAQPSKKDVGAETSQLPSTASTSKSGVIAPQINGPVHAADMQGREVSPQPLECDGCEESDVAYKPTVLTVQCNICMTWSHTDCFADSAELSMHNDDDTWSCPTCRDIVVWTDKK